MRIISKVFIAISLITTIIFSTSAGKINYDSPNTYEKDGILYGYDIIDNTVTEAWVLGLSDALDLSATDGVLEIPVECNYGVKIVAIGRDAFKNRKDLRILKLPISLEEMSSEAFIGCDNFEGFDIDTMNPHIVAEGMWVYKREANPSDSYKTLKNIINYKDKTLTIPSNISSIGPEALSCNEYIEELIFKDGISIGERAFYNCQNLVHISGKHGITLGDYAFAHCKNIKAIDSGKCRLKGKACLGWINELEYLDIDGNDNWMGCPLVGTSIKNVTFSGNNPKNGYIYYLQDDYLMSDEIVYSDRKKHQITVTHIWANFKPREEVIFPPLVWHLEPGLFINSPNLKAIYDNPSHAKTKYWIRECRLNIPVINRPVKELASDDVLQSCIYYSEYQPETTYFDLPDSEDIFFYITSDVLGQYNPLSAFKNWKKLTPDMPQYIAYDYSGIATIETENATVITNDGTITVEGAEGKQVRVYSADGRLLYNGPTGQTGVAGHGIYIVTIGASSVKVAL